MGGVGDIFDATLSAPEMISALRWAAMTATGKVKRHRP